MTLTPTFPAVLLLILSVLPVGYLTTASVPRSAEGQAAAMFVRATISDVAVERIEEHPGRVSYRLTWTGGWEVVSTQPHDDWQLAYAKSAESTFAVRQTEVYREETSVVTDAGSAATRLQQRYQEPITAASIGVVYFAEEVEEGGTFGIAEGRPWTQVVHCGAPEEHTASHIHVTHQATVVLGVKGREFELSSTVSAPGKRIECAEVGN